jgi:7-cyano-7-deazaguanine synthase
LDIENWISDIGEMRAVCLISGGMDSCVAAAEAKSQGFRLAFLHVNYGQRTQQRESRAFELIADYYGVVDRLTVDLGYLGRIGGSALTDWSVPVPEGDLERPGIPISYVPFRNGNLLAIAASWAEILPAKYIYIGAVEEDSPGYPDCRKQFFEAFNRLIEVGTRPETKVEIVIPLVDLSKKEIVLRGLELGAPLDLTWSCYRNDEVACGRCDSCLLRLRGFRQAGIADSIPYNTGQRLK